MAGYINIAALTVISIAFQAYAIYLMPLTRGFTVPLPTIGVGLASFVGLGFMTRALISGAYLSLIVPAVSIGLQVSGILIAVFAYGESVSLGKVLALGSAIVLVGVASSI